MAEEVKLKRPWMVAVWPGMGGVAITAGYYLMAKLDMHLLAEFSPHELFELDHVEVKDGLIQTGRLPRSRLFISTDPDREHDIIVFIGEAQPATGKYAFCRKLIDYAQELGVERVFTFAAMGTPMHLEQDSRVFGAAGDSESLDELKERELEILENGHIGGLNGVLVGVAAERGLSGSCLLGEMPGMLAQLPFPQASLAVLKVFTEMAGIDLDFLELSEQVQASREQLEELLARMENRLMTETTEEEPGELPESEGRLSPAEERQIEQLFEQASGDRSKAYELKRELDRLGMFSEYEDRFLDLFKKPE